MLRKVLNKLRYISKKSKLKNKNTLEATMNKFYEGGKIPWSPGYEFHKRDTILESISNKSLLEFIKKRSLPKGFGHRLDERAIEYPWIFSNLPDHSLKMLDAGSTFNYGYLLNHQKVKNKELTIFTFAPEDECFNKERISYVYGDLRDMYFKDNYFDLVISQSTIEHIDMDNSMYGYTLEFNQETDKKSYEYLKAVSEMLRVLNSKGTLLMTFPFGKFENHGFFQQFDKEMIERIYSLLIPKGTFDTTFFEYRPDGWIFSEMKLLDDIESFNPHTGKGLKDDGAAHSRAVACIKFVKK